MECVDRAGKDRDGRGVSYRGEMRESEKQSEENL